VHQRLPKYAPDALAPERRAVYDAIAGGPRAAGPQLFRLTDSDGALEGPFNAMLASPGVGMALQRLGAAIRFETGLSDRCREIAILTLAAARDSAFEWYAHERLGRQVGLTQDELDALRDHQSPASLSPTESVTPDTVVALLDHRDLDDEQFERARDVLGLERLVELVTLTGYYDLLALSLRVFRVPLPDDEA
jgi:alkylhydroperoxidase family enzyme